ncbi:hypothetical protein [Bacillus wiedmannii]|uniref:hypothetical protein n=1 Tax=Bacillus wiedmannii TaxID=1890302 RepID=UPI00086B4760|nr:hypothetical protein [Bacillus wiedmannii]SCN34180.1 Uncharacterized protein BCRIVMBC938_02026 [Bacillus wiedmannii]
MKPLDRKESGNLGESQVFAKLVSLGHTVEYAEAHNQEGYDLIISDTQKKIEVKHIQRSGSASRDSFILKEAQAQLNAFDNLILLVSDYSINNSTYYIFSYQEIQNIIWNKKTSSGNFTLNLNKDGTKLAGIDLLPFQDQWQKIKN